MHHGKHRLTAAHRLKRPADFRRVYANGEKAVAPSMVMWAHPATTPLARAGVVASKRRIGNAVCRNRARRRLREVWRQHRACLAEPMDLVLIARPALLDRSWAQVVDDFKQCAMCIAPSRVNGEPS